MLSAIALGFILPVFERSVGLPVQTLHLLALLAAVFASYSLGCFWSKPANWRPFLQAIALANLLYGVMTVALLLFHYQKVKALGWLYFGLELTVIVLLSRWELQTAARPNCQDDQ
ncbi:hypothetical protein [Hymenobacter sp. BT190]|uniref:hypothetical protein n=1 Tax=Hymenobacter sp. BT190 TaxID=2763505 RepID=UPI001650E23E|nr:hypothetical protein [Hymenobacter sp. BT190]MBC6700132.1 hypothetical protein [Hymenobacter sp. BT190]